MTDYNVIADTDVDAESPVNVSLLTRLRDNVLAIQENDASAPTVAFATAAGSSTSAASLNGFYTGRVAIDGAGANVVSGNSGFSGTFTVGTASYELTHNLNTTDCSIVVTDIYYSPTANSSISSQGANSITFYLGAIRGFHFQLTLD
jgi:hypothetical protein